MLADRAERFDAVRVELAGVMRVNSGRRVEGARQARAELGGLNARRDRSSRHDEAPDPGGRRSLEHGIAIGRKALVREIHADVDQIQHARIVTTACFSGNPAV